MKRPRWQCGAFSLPKYSSSAPDGASRCKDFQNPCKIFDENFRPGLNLSRRLMFARNRFRLTPIDFFIMVKLCLVPGGTLGGRTKRRKQIFLG